MFFRVTFEVFSLTVDEHYIHVEDVLKKIKNADIILNENKGVFVDEIKTLKI